MADGWCRFALEVLFSLPLTALKLMAHLYFLAVMNFPVEMLHTFDFEVLLVVQLMVISHIERCNHQVDQLTSFRRV